jgi:hypothetical protein
MGNMTVIEQQVDCAFGEDHKVLLELEQGKLSKITCSCYNNKKEVKGLIELGKLKHSTCMQAMDYFLEASLGKINHSMWNSPYADSVIGNLPPMVKQNIGKVQGERARLAQEIAKLREKETLIARKLREYMTEEVGQVNDNFAVLYENKENVYTFNIVRVGSGRSWNAYKQGYDEATGTFTPIASRKDGKWHLYKQWETLVEDNVGNDRRCRICEVYGGYDHTQTKGHKSKARKYTAMALQATSADGVKIVRANKANRGKEDAEGNSLYISDYLFKYRKGTKRMIGVVLP